MTLARKAKIAAKTKILTTPSISSNSDELSKNTLDMPAPIVMINATIKPK